MLILVKVVLLFIDQLFTVFAARVANSSAEGGRAPSVCSYIAGQSCDGFDSDGRDCCTIIQVNLFHGIVGVVVAGPVDVVVFHEEDYGDTGIREDDSIRIIQRAVRIVPCPYFPFRDQV